MIPRLLRPTKTEAKTNDMPVFRNLIATRENKKNRFYLVKLYEYPDLGTLTTVLCKREDGKEFAPHTFTDSAKARYDYDWR